MTKYGTAEVVRNQGGLCNAEQAWGLPIGHSPTMSNVFMAGPDLVRWELTACGEHGPYRLTIRHANGSIVEYFQTTTAALEREAELEELLIAARAGRPLHAGATA
jgi:hypothetical protein